VKDPGGKIADFIADMMKAFHNAGEFFDKKS
jgi:hypothetical protein